MRDEVRMLVERKLNEAEEGIQYFDAVTDAAVLTRLYGQMKCNLVRGVYDSYDNPCAQLALYVWGSERYPDDPAQIARKKALTFLFALNREIEKLCPTEQKSS